MHEISADQLDGRLFIEMHLEVDEQLSLREAHRRATELEEEIRKLPGVAASSDRADAKVNIHIEPLGTHIASVDGQRGEMTGLGRAIEKYINTLPREFHELVDCHEVHVRQVEHKILVSCHCAMDGSLPITANSRRHRRARRPRKGKFPADRPRHDSSRAGEERQQAARTLLATKNLSSKSKEEARLINFKS